MNIIYIHQYFYTPADAGGTRSYWNCKELIARGHQVTVIAGSSKIEKDIEEKIIEGIKVIYIKEAYHQSMSVKARLKSFIGFMRKSIKVAKQQQDIDLVFATSTPLTVGIPALYLKWFKKTPYIFEVRDLWPEVPIQMGAIKNPFLIWATRKLEKTIYRNANHVIALSPGMQEGVMHYIPKNKTSMIPNMSKKDEFWEREKNLELMKEMKLREDSFKVIYFGAMGLANAVHTLVDAANQLKDDNNIEFLFIGGGSQEAELKELAVKLQLPNVHFYGEKPLKTVSEVLNFSDVSIVLFEDIPILYTNSPNKLFDSLSAGKPIIVNSAGWTKAMVEENNCGLFANPKIDADLAHKIKYIQENPDLAKDMGINARKLAETTYDKSILCKEFVDTLEKYAYTK
ncbi:MAG: glycosyltransferase family 4 protein [Brumimicrobium sp.]|nr:glycosyltransferase family 4 protein [Brumimicrobium sp.]